MTSRKIKRPNNLPSVKTIVPVYVPSNNPDGTAQVEMGQASLRGGQLVIKFDDSRVSTAIQRMLIAGHLLGISFVMIAAQKDVENVSEETENTEPLPEAVEKETTDDE